MIFVQRATEPPVLQRNRGRWYGQLQQAQEQLKQLRLDPSATKSQVQAAQRAIEKIIKSYNKREIKQALTTMFHGKCAYCESKIDHIDFGDIEHFYPKAKYPNKCFDWENLLLACKRCNEEAKKDQFPHDDQGNPLLIDPTMIDPNEHLHFDWDPTAKLATVFEKTHQGQATITVCDLNRSELLKHRSRFVKNLYALYLFSISNDPQASIAQQLLDEAKLDQSEYAAFARIF